MIPYKVEFVVGQQDNGKFGIFKLIEFEQKVKIDLAKSVLQGTGEMLSWGDSSIATRKAIVYMVQKMGGFQGRTHHLSPEKKGPPRN